MSFADTLKDIMDQLRADRPDGALPYGACVKSHQDDRFWGVVTEAQETTQLTDEGNPYCTYLVTWLNSLPKNQTHDSNTKDFSLHDRKIKRKAGTQTIESDFTLIVPLDESGNPFVFDY
tara:strand:- start:1589 stop:1945 length:357 start_codon:yes stop_codon:yes gene_type:complete